jgi:hypothetical protein
MENRLLLEVEEEYSPIAPLIELGRLPLPPVIG